MSNKAEFSDSDFEPIIPEDEQICNYCNRRTTLMADKPYCSRCHGMMFRECKRCHKPFHLQRYFEKDDLRCNGCFEKLQKERLKRAMKKQRIDVDDEDEDPFTAGPSKPKKRATVPKSTPPAASGSVVDIRSTPFGEFLDAKEARVGYIPIIFK